MECFNTPQQSVDVMILSTSSADALNPCYLERSSFSHIYIYIYIADSCVPSLLFLARMDLITSREIKMFFGCNNYHISCTIISFVNYYNFWKTIIFSELHVNSNSNV